MKYITIILFLFCFGFVTAQNTRVDAIGITVSDLDKALAFYTKVLPFEKISETEIAGDDAEKLKGVFGIHYRTASLRLGNEIIILTDYLTAGGKPVPVDSHSNDLWFQHIAIVVSNMDSAYARLRKFNVEHVSTAPQTLPITIPAAAGIRAFYFHDPDGHNLELIYFPQGKGNPKWQTPSTKIFLGIDHTAIGISQTVQSKRFYGDLLGITYQGESFNAGKEQEHLNNVAGARLHISGNKGSAGPGVEFLEYENPKNGRTYPVDERADDLIHWETLVHVTDINDVFQKLKATKARFVSNEIVTLSSPFGYQKGFYVRDPDGHVVGVFQ